MGHFEDLVEKRIEAINALAQMKVDVKMAEEAVMECIIERKMFDYIKIDWHKLYKIRYGRIKDVHNVPKKPRS